MAEIGLTFDASKVEPVNFDRIPTGVYKAVITKSEIQENKSTQGHHLNLTLEVVEGDHMDAVVYDKLNLWNQSQKAAQIAAGTLSAIARAVGVMQFDNTDALHNRPMMIKVVLKSDPQHGEQNEVKSYKSITTDPNAPSPGGSFMAKNPNPQQAQQSSPPVNPNLNTDGTPKTPQQMSAMNSAQQ